MNNAKNEKAPPPGEALGLARVWPMAGRMAVILVGRGGDGADVQRLAGR